MSQPIRLLIVDDHPTIRFGLVALFAHESDFSVVGEASNGFEAVEKAISTKPDVILMDLALPKMGGLQAMSEILAECPQIRIIVFTAFSDSDQILAATKAGAIGYLLKDSSPQELFKAIHNAMLGKPAFNAQVELSLLQSIRQPSIPEPPVEKLTEREIEILRWLAQGLSNSDIAQKACITEGTVRSHISNLLNKLGLSNRAQAVIYAIRNGLINLDSQ